MQILSKMLSALLVSFFMAFSSVAFAASDVSPVQSQQLTGVGPDTAQQGPDKPKDCKKNPQDPRCK
jgi:hypothetical protein